MVAWPQRTHLRRFYSQLLMPGGGQVRQVILCTTSGSVFGFFFTIVYLYIRTPCEHIRGWRKQWTAPRCVCRQYVHRYCTSPLLSLQSTMRKARSTFAGRTDGAVIRMYNITTTVCTTLLGQTSGDILYSVTLHEQLLADIVLFLWPVCFLGPVYCTRVY